MVLPNITELGLVNENIVISKSLVQPISTIFSILLLLLLIILAGLSYKRAPYISFGITWFIIGHALESTIFPLDLRYEHRNYLPSFGIFLAICISISKVCQTRDKEISAYILLSVWLIAVSTVTLMRSFEWKNDISQSLSEVERHPESSRANMIMGSVYQAIYINSKDAETRNKLYSEGIKYFHNTKILDPNSVTPLLATSIFNCLHLNRMPKHDLQRVLTKIQATNFKPDLLNALALLTSHVIDGKCQNSNRDYLNIMNNALSNPNLKGKYKAQVLYLLSNYYNTVAKDIDIAEVLLEEAAEFNPSNFSYKIELSKLMLANGDYQGALSLIQELNKIDKYRTYSKTISESLEFIEKHR